MTKEFSVCEPDVAADATVIWLHGLGADGSDFMGVVDQLGLPAKHAVRFIFPNAPYKSITVNQGMKMRAWYDIYDLNLLRKEDTVGLQDSQKIIMDLVQHEIAQGIDSERIILAGFSQGAALSLYVGLRSIEKLGGMVILSGYLPLADSFEASKFPINHDTPIFIAHGMFDAVVPLQAGKAAAQILTDQNYNVTWSSYPIPHTVSLDEIKDIGKFMCECLDYA